MLDRAQSIADQALQVPEAERAALVRRECGPEREDLFYLVMGLLTDPGRLAGRSEAPAGRAATIGAPSRSDSGHAETSPLPPLNLPASDSNPINASLMARLGDDFDERAETVGPYRLIKRLGMGGMGVVWLATRDDSQVTQRVAIKLIRAMTTPQEAAAVVKRFELERQVLSAMSHPNIARLIDAGQLPPPDGRPYLVMEYVEGEPIDEYCDRMELNITERITLFKKVCDAVHHAHQNLVVHRDIKPNNILVDSRGEPKLMDFGIAKILNVGLAANTLVTREGHGPMTPEYASPEQVLGKPVGTSSDIYSLGVLLYQLLTGRRPYRLKDRAMDAVVRAVAQDEPERPSTAVSQEHIQFGYDGVQTTITADVLAKPREGAVGRLRRRLSGDIDNIVLMAMRKSPQRRYASAAAFAEDLQRHLDGQPVAARGESWGYVAGKMLWRNRLAAAAAAAVLITTSLAAAYSWTAWRSERAARTAEHQARADAEKRLDQVRDLAANYLAELGKRIEKHRGATETLALLSDTSLQLLEKLAQEFPEDPQLGADLSDGYYNMAKALGGTRGPGQGDTAAALAMTRKCIDVRRRLAADPASIESARRLAAALDLEADFLVRAEKTAEARRALDESVRILQGAAANDSSSARTLAISLLNRADLLKSIGEQAASDADLEGSFAIRKRLYESNRDNTLLERDYTVGLSRMADAAFERDDVPRAEAMLREALKLREHRYALEPNARTERDIATAARALGKLLLQKQRPSLDDAQACLSRHREIVTKLAEADPSNARAQDDVLDAMVNMAELASARGDATSAMNQWRRAADRARDLADAAPADASRRRFLARTLEQLAHAQDAAGEDPAPSIAAALAAYEKLPSDAETEQRIAELRGFLRGREE